MKKILSGILVLCLSLALLSACDRGGQPDKTVTAGGLTFAKSYSEVYSALTDAQKAIAERNTLLNTGADSSEPNGAGAAGEGSEGTFYSGTNVQVEGVDEGDIVKTDGKYIYILRGSEMVVMQADGGRPGAHAGKTADGAVSVRQPCCRCLGLFRLDGYGQRG